MKRVLTQVDRGPEGRQEIFRRVRAGNKEFPCEFGISGGPGRVSQIAYRLVSALRASARPLSNAALPRSNDRSYFLAALRASAIIAVLLLANCARAQESSPANDRPFTASLLLIKADWSKSPAAKEIDADLRKAFRAEILSKGQLEAFPRTGPAAVFPTDMATIYDRGRYAQLLAWLHERQLFQEMQQFEHGPAGSYQLPGRELVVMGSAMLQKDAEFIESPTERKNRPALMDHFMMWHVSISALGGWGIQSWEHRIDQSTPPPLRAGNTTPTKLPAGTKYDERNVHFPPPREDQVLLMHAFPA